jgi:DNA-binding NtrC family response regulator
VPKDKERDSASTSREDSNVPRNQPDTSGPILIVEDDELMRLSLEDRFRLEGFSVLVASTVEGAQMRLAAGPRPSLVITDVRLPDGSGARVFETCRCVAPSVPVIVMTGFGSVVDAVRLVKAGALDYLEKPFSLDDLVATVRMTLMRGEEPGERALRNSVEDAERHAIAEALVRNGWAISKTADALGISRKNLWEKMRRYRIERQ